MKKIRFEKGGEKLIHNNPSSLRMAFSIFVTRFPNFGRFLEILERSKKSLLKFDLFLVITPTIFALIENNFSKILKEKITEPIYKILIYLNHKIVF